MINIKDNIDDDLISKKFAVNYWKNLDKNSILVNHVLDQKFKTDIFSHSQPCFR